VRRVRARAPAADGALLRARGQPLLSAAAGGMRAALPAQLAHALNIHAAPIRARTHTYTRRRPSFCVPECQPCRLNSACVRSNCERVPSLQLVQRRALPTATPTATRRAHLRLNRPCLAKPAGHGRAAERSVSGLGVFVSCAAREPCRVRTASIAGGRRFELLGRAVRRAFVWRRRVATLLASSDGGAPPCIHAHS
jgi:hypothetical protein